MDPLILNPYLNDLILQHLNFNEILECSTVSKGWNREIGESRKCMSRVKFSLKFWKSSEKQKQTEDKVLILKNVTRYYQHVTIDCRFDKNLSAEFWRVLKHLEKSIMTLKIKSIKIENPSALTGFPRLQELKLVYVPLNIRNILVTSSSSFKRVKLKLISPLNWRSTKSDPASLEAVRKFLESNQKLEELEIHGSVQFGFLFDADTSDVIRFKLKKFKVKTDMRLAFIFEESENNLVKFLNTQNTLEEIFIDRCRPHVIAYIFNEMPMLKSIHIETVVKDFRVKDLKLNLNEHVVDLKIPYINLHEDIREILSVTSNLETLFISQLSHETMNFIAWNLKNLRTLKYRYDEIDCEMLYDKLKDENEEVNQNIEMIVDYEYA